MPPKSTTPPAAVDAPVSADLGRVAFEAFALARGDNAGHTWNELVQSDPGRAAAWAAAGRAVVDATFARS